MIFFPNKNSKEFQDLVSSVGENQAYFLWNKYEGNVPQSYFSGIKKDASELFESNPELSSIGTQQQYSQYLQVILLFLHHE